jgi:hypothetical protein
MATRHPAPTHRVVIYRHEYGFRVSPGVLHLVQGERALVRVVNLTALAMRVSRLRARGSFRLRPAGYKDVRVPTERTGSIPYTVEVTRAGIEAEGGSGPRIIITP